jgi:hypothetical protein
MSVPFSRPFGDPKISIYRGRGEKNLRRSTMTSFLDVLSEEKKPSETRIVVGAAGVIKMSYLQYSRI